MNVSVLTEVVTVYPRETNAFVIDLVPVLLNPAQISFIVQKSCTRAQDHSKRGRMSRMSRDGGLFRSVPGNAVLHSYSSYKKKTHYDRWKGKVQVQENG